MPPSMIQLLDMSFHDESWKKILVVKEAWNGYDLLWRDEAWPGDLSESVTVEDTISPVEVDLSTLPTAEQNDTTSEHVQPKPLAETISSSGDVDVSDQDEPEQVEHPAMKELREKELTRTRV